LQDLTRPGFSNRLLCQSGVEAATSGKPQFPFEAAGQFGVGRGCWSAVSAAFRRAKAGSRGRSSRRNCKLTHHPIRLRLDRLTPLMAGGW